MNIPITNYTVEGRHDLVSPYPPNDHLDSSPAYTQ